MENAPEDIPPEVATGQMTWHDYHKWQQSRNQAEQADIKAIEKAVKKGKYISRQDFEEQCEARAAVIVDGLRNLPKALGLACAHCERKEVEKRARTYCEQLRERFLEMSGSEPE